MTINPSRVIKIFFSYSHEDELFLESLEKQLSTLRWQGIITDWHDRKIIAGQDWSHEIDINLNTADIILLLVSPDFLASGYCFGVEMTRALARHQAGQAWVIPIILRPCDWQNTPFGRLQVLPRYGKPVTTWPDRDQAFFEIVMGIRDVIKQMLNKVYQNVNNSNRDRPSSQRINNRTQSATGHPNLTSNLNKPYNGKPIQRQSLDQLRQVIGTLISFVLGVLALLAPFFGLPDPGREICIAISIVFIGFALIGIYILFIHVRAQRKLSPKEKLGSGVMAIGLLFIAVLILNPVFSALTVLGKPTSIKPTATQTPTQPSAFTKTPTLPATPSVTVTDTSNPVSNSSTGTQNIPENRKLICTACGYPGLSITLNSITIDPGDNKTILAFTLSNQGTHSCSNGYFGTLAFQDTEGNKYNPQQPNWISVAPNNSIEDHESFNNLIPVGGTEYTLSIIFEAAGNCSVSNNNTYQNENFTFSALPTPNISNIHTISENRKLICTACGYPGLSITLNSITIDPGDNKTILAFTLSNQGAQSCSNGYFGTLALQDTEGNKYNPQQPNWISVAPNNSIKDFEDFNNLTSTGGTPYTLSIIFEAAGNCSVSNNNTYQNMTFTF